MNIIRFEVDKDQNKPILIPQYSNRVKIYKSKHDKDRLMIKDEYGSWEFNKFDILTGVNLFTGVINTNDLKDRYKNKSKSVTKKYIRKSIKFLIRSLKSLLNYFN